jgi:MerR family transcriptional regulator/heat shock protein HspR
MTTEREDATMPEAKQAIDERAVFIISVAAELAGVHPQTLRIYERTGLVRPKRTSVNTRRYTLSHIDRLLAIQ